MLLNWYFFQLLGMYRRGVIQTLFSWLFKDISIYMGQNRKNRIFFMYVPEIILVFWLKWGGSIPEFERMGGSQIKQRQHKRLNYDKSDRVDAPLKSNKSFWNQGEVHFTDALANNIAVTSSSVTEKFKWVGSVRPQLHVRRRVVRLVFLSACSVARRGYLLLQDFETLSQLKE